jgi:hypothetical protein
MGQMPAKSTLFNVEQTNVVIDHIFPELAHMSQSDMIFVFYAIVRLLDSAGGYRIF